MWCSEVLDHQSSNALYWWYIKTRSLSWQERSGDLVCREVFDKHESISRNYYRGPAGIMLLNSGPNDEWFFNLTILILLDWLHAICQMLIKVHTVPEQICEAFRQSKWVDGIKYEWKLCPRIINFLLLYTNWILSCNALEVWLFIHWLLKFNPFSCWIKKYIHSNFRYKQRIRSWCIHFYVLQCMFTSL